MTKRIWVLGAFSNEMADVENLLTKADEPFVYACIFLPGSGRTARVSKENAHSIDAYANVKACVLRRAYFIECSARLNSQKEPSISISFSGPDIAEQVANELARLGRL